MFLDVNVDVVIIAEKSKLICHFNARYVNKNNGSQKFGKFGFPAGRRTRVVELGQFTILESDFNSKPLAY